MLSAIAVGGRCDELNARMEPREPRHPPYLAPLDGLRAVAILAVLLFHVWPAALRGGFVGVDVFFVLSGYLIAALIRRDLETGEFSLKAFYLRRIQRLLPNAMATILGVLVLWSLFLPPNAAVQPGIHGLWTLANLSNLYVWKNLGGYWGSTAEWAPLTHFWSLGVEEQFYLVFPGALVWLSRVRPRQAGFWLVVATVGSFGLCLYGTYAYPTATFYLMPTRVWELLLGALLAVHRPPFGQAETPRARLGAGAREVVGWTGLMMIAAGCLLIGEGSRFPGLVVLAPVVGTVLVLLSVADGETRVSRLLSAPVMVGTGKLSYSVYLWHWPLIIFGRLQAEFHGLPPLAGAAAGGAGGVLLAWAAYVGIERPLRVRAPGRSWRLATIVGGFLLAALGCGLSAVRRTDADPGHRFDTPTSSLAFYDVARRPAPPDFSRGEVLAPAGADFPPEGLWRTGGIVHLHGGGRPSVVVLGSSQAMMYSRLVDDLCRERGLSVAFFGASWATPAFFDAAVNPGFPSRREAREFDQARRKYLAEWRPEVVIVADLWGKFVESREFEGKFRSFLSEVAPQARRVLFVAEIPFLDLPGNLSVRGYVAWRMDGQEGLPALLPDAGERFRNEAVRRAEGFVGDFPNLRVIRADRPFYQRDGSIRYSAGRNFFYLDRNHLTDIGAEEVRGLFRAAIAEAQAASLSR
ncbi:MAG: acyltransferase family protein [Verrucomicrobia bacterium]|nr:acyltransferase family protein [Verrucomicrobiota bacterium]